MMKDLFSFNLPDSKNVRIVIIRLENGEIVARTVEELEKMKERGEYFEILKEEV